MDFVSSILAPLAGAWPIWATLGAFILLRGAFAISRWIRLARAGLNDVDRMTAEEFTECVTCIFEDLGHDLEVVLPHGEGALIIVTIDGVRTAVQAEHRAKGNVPSRAVEAVIGAQAIHNCPDSMVVTNQQFTPKARELARANSVVLCNRDELALMLQEWQETEAAREKTKT